MKNFFKIFTIIVLFACTTCMQTTYEERISPIVGSNLPSSVKMGQTVNFTVSHIVDNSCGQFSRSEIDINGRNVTVRFYAKYPNLFCRNDKPVRETDYSFKPLMKGEYYFKFYQDFYSESEYLLDTLVVH